MAAGDVDVLRGRHSGVIFACHSAQALAMLAAPTDSEREVLGDIGWQRNEVVCN